MATATTVVCPECEDTEFDPERDDCRWSPVREEYVCWPCWQSAEQYASTIIPFPQEDPDDPNPYKIIVHDLGVEDIWGDTDGLPYVATRRHVSTDGWRGYDVTEVEGWTEVETGAALWGRTTDILTLCERIAAEQYDLPCPVLVVTDLTTNVFSVVMSVLVRDGDEDAFLAWARGEGDDDE